MTVYLKNNPVGIDSKIDACQKRLNSLLGWSNAEIYGRIYLNTLNGGKIAEAWKENDYKQIFVDDTVTATIGFIDSTRRAGGNHGTTDFDVICSVQLDKLYSGTERKDEEAMLEVLRIIDNVQGVNVTGIRKRNIDEVFNFMDTSSIVYRDMQNWAVFALECTTTVINNICKTV